MFGQVLSFLPAIGALNTRDYNIPLSSNIQFARNDLMQRCSAFLTRQATKEINLEAAGRTSKLRSSE